VCWQKRPGFADCENTVSAGRADYKEIVATPSGERRLPACRVRQLAECICTQLPYSYQSRLAAGCRQLQAGSLCCPTSAMTTRWNRKDLLGLRELSADEINLVLDTADAFKQVGTREIKKVPALRGKTLVNFFVEPSTRTRTSFELAAFRLSADVINISAATSSLSKGETLKDTAKILEANHVDIIVLRHSSAGAPQFLAERLRSSVINAGDGAHEHPTQGLLDTYTIREKKKRIEGLNVAIIGDILFSRVARSNIFALTKLGARVTLVGPSTLLPRDFEKLGVTISYDIDEVLPTADVVNLLRIQHERQRKEYFPGIGEYIKLFGLTKERGKLLKPDCLIMHPGPINRGVEIDSELADGNQSVILDQVTNGLAVRMAVLYLCGGIAA
jgi:aspartate carbamoyltransferase catalytic subunit